MSRHALALTDHDMREVLRSEIALSPRGSIRSWCEVHGVSASLASEFLLGRTPCPPAIASALGYRREVRYVPVGRRYE